MLQKWIVRGVATLLLSLAISGAARADSVTPAQMRIVAALDNIRTLTLPDKDGYATIWDGNKYVQCHGGPAQPLRCEAAGALMQPSLAPVLTANHIKSLAASGWKPNSSFGSYVRTFPASTSTGAVADAVLAALTSAYDASPDQLETSTTWVDAEPCPPRNGPSQNLAGSVNDAPSMAATAVHACAYIPDQADAGAVALTSAEALVARDSAMVSDHLQRLRINAGRRVFTAFDPGIGYIQCEPQTAPAVIYCEAQSAFSWAALSSILTPARIAELHADGYADPGYAPNYSKTYPADRYDNAAIAREVLTLLFDVYGYNGTAPLTIKTEMDPQSPAQAPPQDQ